MWSKERVWYDGHKEKKLLKSGVRPMGNSGAKGGFAHWCSECSQSLRFLPSLSLHKTGTLKRPTFLLLSCIIIFSSWLISFTSHRRQGPKFPDLIIKNLCANTHNVTKSTLKPGVKVGLCYARQFREAATRFCMLRRCWACRTLSNLGSIWLTSVPKDDIQPRVWGKFIIWLFPQQKPFWYK